MKNIILFVFLSVIFACSPKEICKTCSFTCISNFDETVISNNCRTNYTCEFLLENDMAIDSLQSNGMKDSTGFIVLYVNTYTNGSDDIADDELDHEILIQVKDDIDSFAYSDAELEDYLISKTTCFCLNVRFKRPKSGCVEGERKEGTWYVQGEVVMDEYTTHKFDFEVQ